MSRKLLPNLDLFCREFRKQRKKGSSGQNEHIFESATEESVINETDSVDQSANDSLKVKI